MITMRNYGIIGGTEYRNAPAVLETPRRATWKVVAPMHDHSIPCTTEETNENPAGHCQCGCGGVVGTYRYTNRAKGQIKGRPWRFIHGHQHRRGALPLIAGPDKDTLTMPIERQGETVVYVVIDRDDASIARRYRWNAVRISGRYYAISGDRLLHRLIMEPIPDGMEVDHIDGDSLNNRRSNLRIVSHAQNNMNKVLQSNNTSGFKGVSWNRNAGKWSASIKKRNRKRHIGLFASREEAARAYDDAARELHGEFARLNFPRPGERGAR